MEHATDRLLKAQLTVHQNKITCGTCIEKLIAAGLWTLPIPKGMEPL